jgi:hypothetical protein
MQMATNFGLAQKITKRQHKSMSYMVKEKPRMHCAKELNES